MQINEETPLAALTVSQFVELLDKRKTQEAKLDTQPCDYSQGYVYGLKGIRDLFNVSTSTAQKYKDTFLKPAVKQNGRKIVVNVDKALALFDEYKK